MADSLDQITPLILTYNEEPNISRTLAGLKWARRIVVIDSFSTDDTLMLLAQHPQVQVVQREFDSFAEQCHFGLNLITTPWCLSLDADHFITSEFTTELAEVISSVPTEVTAVLTSFRYCVQGFPLRGTLLPPRFNLMRPDGGSYVNDGHAHRFIPVGRTLVMRQPIFHDDRKSLSRWLTSQQRYLLQETQKLISTPDRQLSFGDRLRKRHVIAPLAVFFLCLIWHRGILDGRRGWFYACQRLYVEILLSLMIFDARINNSRSISR
ncbi:glycosyltransferase family 2 protein [Synechococcus sp. AH-736-G20]|nr:glycosyltransferase family 2 protein [Synechococcus sp. AH-736-G20]